MSKGQTTELKLLTKHLDPRYPTYDATLPVIEWDWQKMRSMRDYLGWTQADVAKAIGRDSQTYHSWENDKRSGETKRGLQNLQKLYNQALTPLYQAIIDSHLDWAIAVGTNASGDGAALIRLRPHGDGLVRIQIGYEHRGLFISEKEAKVSVAQYNTFDMQLRAAGGEAARQLAS